MSAGAPRVGSAPAIPRAAPIPATRARTARRTLTGAILLLAFVHALLYAAFLPPWGVMDEEQHLHYIESLAETGRPPVAHQDLLSPEIVESLFATNRWGVLFHQAPPASPRPQDMGLEAYSYEGYQPPLYYALLAPIYRVLPDDILVKLYALRALTAALSLLTVYLALRAARELTPRPAFVPYAVALLIAVVPERTMAAGRVNNDALVEVLAAGLVWATMRAHRVGLDSRRSALLGVLYGLGVLAKMTMAAMAPILLYLLVMRRPRRAALHNTLLMGACAALPIAPLIARNLTVYGDLTGFGGFSCLMGSVGGFLPPTPSIGTAVDAIVQSATHVWFVWWKGAEVGGNALTRVAYALLLAATAIAVAGLLRSVAATRRRHEPSVSFFLLLFALVPFYALLAAISYWRGEVPIVQGRFLLPALVPAALAFVMGLWRFRWGAWAYAGTVALLVAMSAALLLGNLLPDAYYWSAVVGGAAPAPAGLDAPSVWAVLYPRLLADKPAALRPLLPALLPAYAASLIAVLASLRYWHKVEHDAIT